MSSSDAGDAASSGANAGDAGDLLGGARGELAGALAVGRAQELGGRTRRCRELVEVPQPLALGPQRVGLARLDGASWSTRATRSSRSSRRRAASAASPRADSSAASAARSPRHAPAISAASCAGAGVRVEQLELPRRAREPAGLVLGRHLDQPLAERLEVGPGARSAPRRTPGCGRRPCRRRATTSVSSPSGREARDRRERRVVEEVGRRVELGLDVGLVAVRPDHAGDRLGTGEKADRLGEHRLPGPGLAREDVQPRSELELGTLDQRQVVDVEPTQHQCENVSR